MRRTASVVLVVVLAALCAPRVAGAESVSPRPATTTFTTTDAMVPVLDGPSGTHANTMDTRLYLPKTATAAHPEPAILMTHGFGGSKLSGEVTSMASFLASHGYVVLTYTSSGFGKSGGCVTLQSADWDAKDAKQLIDKVLQPRPDVVHDAKGVMVGMIGGSYGGGIQSQVAALDPRVRAIAPGRTWNALQYSLDPNNYVVPGDPTGFSHLMNTQGVFKFAWTSLFYALGNAQPVGGAPSDGTQHGGCPQDKVASADPVEIAGQAAGCTGYYLALCETYANIASTGDADATARTLLARASAAYWIDKIKVPTLLVQGQSDTLFNENDAVATYLALKRRGVPVQMIWNAGGHGGYDSLPGECEVYGGGTTGLDDCYLSVRELNFFDHWLRGVNNSSPGFTWYQDWTTYAGKGAADEQYAAASAFPAMPDTKFTLSGTDLLAPGKTPAAGSRFFINPPAGLPAAYTETSNFSGPKSSPNLATAPQEIPGQNVDYTSAAFTSDVVSVGIPSAHLHITNANTRDMVFFGKVYDVDAGGAATLIHRFIAPVRVPAANVTKPVDIKLIGFAHRFTKGHRVRLVLASTDLTSYNAKVPDQITVTTGGADPSTFSLPTSRPPFAASPGVKGVKNSGGSGGGLATTGSASTVPLAALLLLTAAAVLARRRTRAG
ncbi:MAG: type transport system ATP-binding protein [Frankiaceae bacterium]|jgi:ABC-2 type transport system ATP-binding protein|nr:type transport system ATP-binding protein [Frankiaceae bacterium]